NDIHLTARQPGEDLSGATVLIVDRGAAANDSLFWNPFSKTLVVSVAPGTTANQLVSLINAPPGAADDATKAVQRVFSAALTHADETNAASAGTGTLLLGTGRVTGGATARTAATATFDLVGKLNKLLFTAVNAGTNPNGVVIQFVNTGHALGAETVAWDPLAVAGPTLTFDINPATTATRIIAVLNADSTARQIVTAALTTGAVEADTGAGTIDLASPAASQRIMVGGSITPTAAASGTISIPNANNDLRITARQNGDDFNAGVTFINTGRARGAEQVTWDAASNVLVFDLADSTTANNVVAAMARPANAAANAVFSVALDTTTANSGAGRIGLATRWVTSAGRNLTWTEFGANLPNAVVTGLDYTPRLTNNAGNALVGSDTLVVGTRGRGTFKLQNASTEVVKRSVLEVTGGPAANSFLLRLSPDRPDGGEQRLEVWMNGVLVGGTTVPLRALDEIRVIGGGVSDVLQVDTRIRVPGGIFFDGGPGASGLTLVGTPGDALISLQNANRAGSIVIGGAAASTSPVLRVNFQRVDVVQANPPGLDRLRDVRSGLTLLAKFQDFSNAFAQQLGNLPVVGGSLTRVLGGAGVPAQPKSDQGDLVVGEPEADGGTSGGSILEQLLAATEDFGLDQIGLASIPTFAELRQRLDDLDSTPGNVTLTETADTTTIDMRIVRDVDGAGEIDVDALAGAIFLKGSGEFSADVTLHLVFGVDEHGFFIDPTPDPELTVRNLQVQGDAEAGGNLGLLDVQVSDFDLTTDPGVALSVDLVEPGPDPFTGATDGKIRLYELDRLSDLFHVRATGSPTANDLTLTGTFTATTSLFGSGTTLGSADVSLVWADISNPFSVTLNNVGVIQTIDDALKSAIRTGLEHVDDLGAFLGGVSFLNQRIPVINKSLNELFPVSTLVELGDAAIDYLDDPDPETPGLELPTVRGLTDALINRVKELLADEQGTLTSGPFTLTGGIFPDTNELRFDLTVDADAHLDLPINLAAELGATGLGVDASAAIALDGALDFSMSFGVDLSDPLSLSADDFFLRLGDLHLTADIAANPLDFKVTFGALGAEIVDGHATLHAGATVAFGTDGHITLADLSGPLADLVHVTLAPAPLDVALPIRTFIGSTQLSDPATTQVLITDADIFSDPAPVVTLPDLSQLADFRNLTPGDIVTMFIQLSGSFREIVSGLDLPPNVPFISDALAEVEKVSDLLSDFARKLYDVSQVTAGADVDAPSGVLSADAVFVVAFDRHAPVAFRVPATETADNTSLDDLVSDVSDAIAAAGLDQLLGARRQGDRLVITTQVPGDSLTLSVTTVQVTAADEAPADGRLGADAHLSVTINGGGDQAVTITQASTSSNTSIADLVAD
ncbi:MAG TPA: hypothetical protein VIH00_09155, partial [Candidatus Limnocylindrales bacterium]